MLEHFADRLTEAIRAKGSLLCVGIDPRWDRLPEELRSREPDQAYYEFSAAVMDAVRECAPAVKFQSAFFEEYGGAGVDAMLDVARKARVSGFIVIGDVKRSDIGSTAEAYARAYLGSDSPFDAITVNPYLGWEGIEPFLLEAGKNFRGLFVLLRTSNPGSEVVQMHGWPPLYRRLAELIAERGSTCPGRCGYSLLGAVIGAGHTDIAGELRELMPGTYFLLPGFGAQGATAEDALRFVGADGLGVLVVAARSVIYAFTGKRGDWREAIGAEAAKAARCLALS